MRSNQRGKSKVEDVIYFNYDLNQDQNHCEKNFFLKLIKFFSNTIWQSSGPNLDNHSLDLDVSCNSDDFVYFCAHDLSIANLYLNNASVTYLTNVFSRFLASFIPLGKFSSKK